MQSANNKLADRQAKRWSLLLGVLILLISQLFLQLHAAEHLSDADKEICEICVTGGAIEHAVVGLAQVVFASFQSDMLSAAEPFIITNSRPIAFHSRAPPSPSATKRLQVQFISSTKQAASELTATNNIFKF